MKSAVLVPLLAAIWLGQPAPAEAAASVPAGSIGVAADAYAAPAIPEARTWRATAPAAAEDQSGARRRPPPSNPSGGSSGGQSGAVRRPPPSPPSGGSSAGAPSGRSGGRSSGATRRRAGDGNRDGDRGGDRGSNIVVDRAVPRAGAPRPPRDVYIYRPHYRYYDPWGYGAFGLGYFYYSPWSYGRGYGYGGPYWGQYAGPYGYDIGSVRLKVKPEDAEVYVDGYYAGTVDDFDGIFQSLKLDSGGYRIEIRKDGFEPLTFDVRVQYDRKITFRGELEPIP